MFGWKSWVGVTCFFWEEVDFEGRRLRWRKVKFARSPVLAVFAGFRMVLSASPWKMTQKSPVTSSVALLRLENETVMPDRENKNNEKSSSRGPRRPGTGWEYSNKLDKDIFLIGVKFGEFIFCHFFWDFQRAAAAFSGENWRQKCQKVLENTSVLQTWHRCGIPGRRDAPGGQMLPGGGQKS